MIPVNGKPIGSFLTIDCYHVGRTPKSVCSGWGEDMFQNQPRQQQKIIPQAINVQRYQTAFPWTIPIGKPMCDRLI
ncbi:hypothetical protein [Limnospira sp. PMC 1236.20]|nr:hypothetical protein [Limnospira sp. PMC 1236.20]